VTTTFTKRWRWKKRKTQEEIREKEMGQQEPNSRRSKYSQPDKFNGNPQSAERLFTLHTQMIFPDDHPAIMFMVHDGRGRN